MGWSNDWPFFILSMNSQKGYTAMHTMQAQHAAHNEAGKHMKGLAILTIVSMIGIAAPLYGFSALAMMFIA